MLLMTVSFFTCVLQFNDGILLWIKIQQQQDLQNMLIVNITLHKGISVKGYMLQFVVCSGLSLLIYLMF